MLSQTRQSWRLFKQSKSGERFEDRYQRRQRSESGRLDPGKIFSIVAGVALILAGLFMVIFPGPGWVTVFLGLGFIAGENRPVARSMDWLEVRARKLVRWAVDLWNRSSTAMRASIVPAIVLIVAGLGYAAYYLFFGG